MRKKNVQLNKLPSNNLTTPNKKDVSPIISGGVKTRKGGGLARDVRNIGNSLFGELILPALKKMALDFLNEAGEQMLFKGQNVPRRGRHQPYNKLYREESRHGRSAPRKRGVNKNIHRSQEVFEDVFLENRREAQLVLGRMMELIADYGVATVGDLYSLVGLGTNITHEGWGWDDLSQTRVNYTSEGYVIDFPEPEYFN